MRVFYTPLATAKIPHCIVNLNLVILHRCYCCRCYDYQQGRPVLTKTKGYVAFCPLEHQMRTNTIIVKLNTCMSDYLFFSLESCVLSHKWTPLHGFHFSSPRVFVSPQYDVTTLFPCVLRVVAKMGSWDSLCVDISLHIVRVGSSLCGLRRY